MTYFSKGFRPAVMLIVAALTFLVSGARAEYLIADLSQHVISIHSRFSGAEVLLFGAKGETGDIIIVLRGPEETRDVRRKARIAGIWLNNDRVRFEAVPGYYAIASTRPVAEIVAPEMLEVNEIGVDNLHLEALDIDEQGDPADVAEFRDALVRNMQRIGLYQADPGLVRVIGDRLFRTRLDFPANVPTGLYRADIYLVDDGIVISKRSTALEVSKTGIEDTVYTFAFQQPLAYGLLAVIVALVAGWTAAAIFRRA
ncbi:MAG: TIGR02186 family protein [Alphaproteobacteria bacterium]